MYDKKVRSTWSVLECAGSEVLTSSALLGIGVGRDLTFSSALFQRTKNSYFYKDERGKISKVC